MPVPSLLKKSLVLTTTFSNKLFNLTIITQGGVHRGGTQGGYTGGGTRNSTYL